MPIAAQYFPVPFSTAQAYVSCNFNKAQLLLFVLCTQLQYISSATSLYFPYDFCLYSEMTTVISYSLRYIPFLLTVVISTIVYTVHRYKIQ